MQLVALVGRRLRRYAGVLPRLVVDQFRHQIMLVVLSHPSVSPLTHALVETSSWKAEAERVAAERAAQRAKLRSMRKAAGVSLERAAFHDSLWSPPGDVVSHLQVAAEHFRSIGNEQRAAELSTLRSILRAATDASLHFVGCLPSSLTLGDSESMERELGWYVDMVLASLFAGLVGHVVRLTTKYPDRRPPNMLLKAIQLFHGGFPPQEASRSDLAIFRLHYVRRGRDARAKEWDPVERQRHLRFIEKLDSVLNREAERGREAK